MSAGTTCIVTPAPASSRRGNRVTALRWARALRQLGERVVLVEEYRDGPWDRLVALHARRSAAAVERCHRERPATPIIVAMTGTDLYEDLPRRSPEALRSLALATRIVVLQPLAVEELPVSARPRARVILQSASPPPGAPLRSDEHFDVCVLGHLREVKDPLRAAAAARLLPPSSRVRVLHAGEALDVAMTVAARAEEAANPRYHWLGARSRRGSLELLARCRLLVVTSRLEGGANVVSEAIACGVPVISTRIAGSIGLLGADYPGYFPVGDTSALAALLHRSETDPAWLGDLRHRGERLRPLFSPALERDAWRSLLAEL